MSQCIRRLFSKTPSRRVFQVEFARPHGLSRRTLHQEPASALLDTSGQGSVDKTEEGEMPGMRTLYCQADIDGRDELLDIITFVLRHKAGTEYGLPSRPDGYLSVEKLLNYPMFHHMDIVHLQWLVKHDKEFRFEINFDPGRVGGPWWLRAKPWDERHRVLKPASLERDNGLGVYITTLKEWNAYISTWGIARLDQDYIRLTPHVNTKNYFESFEREAKVLIFLDISACMISGLRFYHEIHSSQVRDPATTPILTKGNEYGMIPRSHFKSVKYLKARRKHLWGIDAPFPIRDTPVDVTVLDETGRRKTFLPILEKNLHGFVDYNDEIDLRNRPIHPDTLKEAVEVVDLQ